MGRRGENIHKRKDGRWEARIRVEAANGKKAGYKSIYGKSYVDVKKLKTEYLSACSKQKNTAYKNMLFSDAIDLWLLNNFFHQKESTKLKYQGMIERHIRPALGGVDIQAINDEVINQFLVWKKENGRLDKRDGGLSNSYVRTMGIIICSIISYASSKSLCKPLAARIKKPIVEKKKIEILPLNVQVEFEKNLKEDGSLTSLGIVIALNTGLRIGEICALRWEDIDLEKGILYVRHTIVRIRKADVAEVRETRLIEDVPKTRSSLRDIPITSKLQQVLHLAQKNAVSEYVVSENKGFVSPRTFEYRFHGILKKYHVQDTNFHTLRHTFATRCVELNVDVKSLSEILGHANVGITLNTYVHSSYELKKNQLEKLAAF